MLAPVVTRVTTTRVSALAGFPVFVYCLVAALAEQLPFPLTAFRFLRHQPSRPAAAKMAPAKIKPGRPAPAIGPGADGIGVAVNEPKEEGPVPTVTPYPAGAPKMFTTVEPVRKATPLTSSSFPVGLLPLGKRISSAAKLRPVIVAEWKVPVIRVMRSALLTVSVPEPEKEPPEKFQL